MYCLYGITIIHLHLPAKNQGTWFEPLIQGNISWYMNFHVLYFLVAGFKQQHVPSSLSWWFQTINSYLLQLGFLSTSRIWSHKNRPQKISVLPGRIYISHGPCGLDGSAAEVVQYIIQSEAGFYLKGVRLTAGSVQKMSHLTGEISVDGGWGSELHGRAGGSEVRLYLQYVVHISRLLDSSSTTNSGFQTNYIHVVLL